MDSQLVSWPNISLAFRRSSAVLFVEFSISVKMARALFIIFVHTLLCTKSIFCGFLGGLSLHLNHLIAERVSAPYWQFGTLPIGIFLSNLDSRHLITSPRTLYGHFCNLSTFGDSRAI